MSESTLQIGTVSRQLMGDFPDASVSKLRFLEEEGVCIPDRTPAGFRMYSLNQVAFLRICFALQKFCDTRICDLKHEATRLLNEDTYICPSCDSHVDVARHPVVRYALKVNTNHH